MTSAVDICNLALQRLGEASITSLDENSTQGRACLRLYEHARDSEIRAYNWSFARTRASLAASAISPAFGFENQFPLPSDFVRLMPDNEVIDWQIEGRMILTDDDAPLEIIYLKKVTDENDFDDLFIELLVSRMAFDLSEQITQSNTKQQLAAQRYKQSTATARRINSFENTAKEPPTDTWITARL